ncbi:MULTISPECIES: ABC transporter ATP-binding protein [Corynebacterium]|uniref:ABC transporter ATP-binding protein n=1 Tax=Corynebacterium coyleae TaxID=53374 RepID=A0AAP6XPA7_9CORY|nr:MULTISPECIES: ABC transporter ATP-binding protein [Corynebacterium]MDK8241465.1 ABC transporter ATP-binding protein [Corynebacterium coyleae]MDK8663351.1 ABC transporter ATP-binding protein [Corynebacterium coyleae]MDK8706303.1 ABC transporter ATP-binding protein [Corynebacterium coyleae]MDK8733306.1 ABC transporter ATP-binding protein [Corynebacterium coyleae]MDK8824124.1 ABC transporter ATP-binding protein [Corynebacterium coyleae]
MTTAISANQDGNTKSSDDFVLSVSDLRLGTLEGAEILHGVDYTLKRGEIVCLVGESGSGKTTAGLAAMGHLRPGLMLFDGTVTLHSANGTDYDVLNLSEADLRELRGSRIAYVPQDPALSLNPTMRIGEQIREVLDVHSFDGDAGARVREVMRDVDLPDTDEYLARWPHQLSGGQQQRVGIAMAFAMYPDVLILDEPTTGLDVSTQAHVLDTVREMTHKNDIASLYITHDLAVVAELADRVVVMLRGDIVEEGPAQAVLYNPQHPYTQKLLAAIPDLPGRKNITGHGIASAVQVEERDSAAPLLQVNNLEMAYGDNKVLHGIDLTLEEGESILLLGESGSGKTTLARSIAGLNPGYTGEVRLRGELLEHGSRERTVDQRQYVQYIFQSPFSSLNPRRTIGESLSVPLVMSGKLSRKEHRRVVEDVLEAVQLDRSFYDRRPGDLSGGERQRAAIGRALVNAPDVLVCDEITSALDVSVQASILELLADLRAERGLSMLFVTHNIALARHTATRIAVLNKGVIVDEGPVDDVLERPTHEYTKSLLANIPEL